ncbi:MAG: WbqC family protein [Rikenellaceae bacterium]
MGLFATTYFGNIDYFAHAIRSESVIIESNENFIKQTYRNRCSIVTANGVMDLIVPVVKMSGKKSKITETKIDYSTRWQSIHERSIIAAYKNAAYFEHYFDIFEPLLTHRYETLFELNMESLKCVKKALKIDFKTTFTAQYEPYREDKEDYRYTITPKIVADKERFPFYYQVFSEKMEFIHNVSILDLIFCEGNGTLEYLKRVRER